MDGSFFAFALLGALLGYIVGDAQREFRLRREVSRNLALAVSRLDGNGNTVPDGNGNGNPVAGANGDSDANGPAHYVNAVRREARRRAVRGDNNGHRAGAAAPGSDPRRATTATLIGAGRDC